MFKQNDDNEKFPVGTQCGMIWYSDNNFECPPPIVKKFPKVSIKYNR